MIWVNGKGRSILVVEDEPAISEVCVRTLIGEGFQVKVVSNGNAALDVLAEKEYDLCLIDVRTPEMDGVELYARLKQQHPGMVDRVIFTTGDVFSDNIKTFLETAGRPCLPKPFTPDELRIIVRTVPAPG